jgi:hypothetical protein
LHLFEKAGFGVVVFEHDLTRRLKELPNVCKDVIGQLAAKRYFCEKRGVRLSCIEKSRRKYDECMDAADCLAQSCQIDGIAFTIVCLFLR